MPTDLYARWRYRLIPDHVVGELLAKSWIESAIPFLFLFVAMAVFGSIIPNMFSLGNMAGLSRTIGEYLPIGVGLTVVVLAGGIDLSIGSVFALANMLILGLGGAMRWPLALAVPAVIVVGGCVGLINGLLIGYLRLRAFLTTLVMLIVVRAVVDTLLLAYAHDIGNTDIGYAGAKRGRTEPVIPDLPGYPDNINRASDGTFWCGIIGMRAPAFDLAQRMPAFRRRMVMRIARDEWLYPNMNTGGVIKFDLDGKVVASLWDVVGERHPQVTSMREDRGYLYLGGIFNNRIGKYRIPGADPNWTSSASYWGTAP